MTNSKELNKIINNLLDQNSKIAHLMYLSENTRTCMRIGSFQLDLLTKQMTSDRNDDLGEMYKQKSDWFVAKIKELNLEDEILSANLTLNQTIETITIKAADNQIFEKTKHW